MTQRRTVSELRRNRRQRIIEAIKAVLSDYEEIDNRRLAYYVSERCRINVSKVFTTRLAHEMGYKSRLIIKNVDGHLKCTRIISTR